MRRVSADAKLFDNLVELKRHLKICKQCMAAFKAREPFMMCYDGAFRVLEAAIGYDKVVKLRIQAHNTPSGYIIACPDPGKHGKVYALTAPALQVTGVQETIF